jgi:ribonuclease-3
VGGPGSEDVETLAGLVEELPEDLYRQALTHTSWVEAEAGSYKRLALLGDSVLGLSVASEVFARFPELDAGRLTELMNRAVSGVSCSEVGRRLGVPDRLRAEQPHQNFSGLPADLLLEGRRPLAELTEALIGACFLAFGFQTVAAAVAQAFGPEIDAATQTRVDFKSALQEALARRGTIVAYEVTAELGPPHDRTFEVSAMVDGSEAGRGSGPSKKAAEQMAAEEAFRSLGV